MAGDHNFPELPDGSRPNLSVRVEPPRSRQRSRRYTDREPDADMRGIAAMLQRRRRTILLMFLVVFGSVVAITLLMPKTYESSALILVEQAQRMESPALATLERLGRGSQIETETELVTSRRVIERVVDQLDLNVSVAPSPANFNPIQAVLAKFRPGERERPQQVFPLFDAQANAPEASYHLVASDSGRYTATELEADSLVATVAQDFAFGGLSGTLPQVIPSEGLEIEVTEFPRAVQLTQKRITTSRVGRNADLLEVTCEGPSPAEAHQLCETTLAGYMRLRTELRRAEATLTADFLREQAGRLGEQLAAAEGSLEAYGRRNQVVALNDRATAEVQQLVQLKAQRDQLEAERVALALLIRDIEARGSGTRRYRDLASFPTFLQNYAVAELITTLADLENRRSDIATRRSERNADVVALDMRIADIDRQLRGMAVSYERALSAQIGSLDETLAGTARRLAVIPTQQVEFARLERKVDLLDELYRMLETRLREAEVAEAVELPSVRVVDAASLPFRPASPNVPLNLVLGFLLAITSGLGLALYREFRETRVRERQDVERQTGLPVLTVVPTLRHAGSVMSLPALSRPGRHEVRQRLRTTKALWRGKLGKGKKEQEPVFYRPGEDTQVALECFRSLAADLAFAARSSGNGGFRSVVITSAGRDEGKTLTACNLALVRAAQGSRTLLIDADMRGSGVAKFFDFPRSALGLSDVLAGSAEVGTVWRGVVPDSELWVLPAGTPTPHSADLLESNFHEVIESAELQFDLIIVDTPPLNVITDAATVASMVDAVVVVVREGVTEREDLEYTVARLNRAAGNIVGVVLNDVALSKRYMSGYSYAASANHNGSE